MSKGMTTLAVNSGIISCFCRTDIKVAATINSFTDIWELPTGTVILEGTLWVVTADTTATVDVSLLSREASPRTWATITDAIAGDIGLSATRTVALLAPIAGTQAQRRMAVTNTSAGTGDGVYGALILATRPGPEPQAAA